MTKFSELSVGDVFIAWGKKYRKCSNLGVLFHICNSIKEDGTMCYVGQSDLVDPKSLFKGDVCRVVKNHLYHPNRLGIFEFLGGPEQDIIVLSDPDDRQKLFAVSAQDLAFSV